MALKLLLQTIDMVLPERGSYVGVVVQHVKHILQSAMHEHSRGFWGHLPPSPEKNKKNKVLRYAILMTDIMNHNSGS